MPRCHQVFHRSQPSIKLNILKRPTYAKSGNLVRSELGDSLPFEVDFSLLRLIESVYAIQNARLPSTIRSDNAKDLPFLDIETYLVKGSNTSKAEIKAFNL